MKYLEKQICELLKEIDEDTKKMLSEKRYIHCKNVMKRAVELAKAAYTGDIKNIVELGQRSE